MTRAWLVGFAVYVAMLLAPGVDVPINNLAVVLYFGTMGSVMLALLGIVTGIWADKFDHAAAVTNFIVQPLTLLSGTFYAIDRVSPAMKLLSHANPFFYIIDGFRFGFLGVADGLALQGAVIIGVIDVALWAVCLRALSTGWRLKA